MKAKLGAILVAGVLFSTQARADMIWRIIVTMPDMEQKTYAVPEADFDVPVKVRGWDKCFINKLEKNDSVLSRTIMCLKINGDYVSTHTSCMAGYREGFGSLVLGNSKWKTAGGTEIKLNCTDH